MKAVDRVLLRVIFYLYFFFALFAVFKKPIFFLPLFFLCVFVVETIVFFLTKRKKVSPEKIKRYLSFKGNDYTLDLLLKLFKHKDPTVYKDKILLKHEGKTLLLYNAIKYSSLGFDDVKNAIFIAEETGADEIYLLFSSLDRKALSLEEYSLVPIKILPFSRFCKYAVKHGFTLPEDRRKYTFKKLKNLLRFSMNPFVARRLILASVFTVFCSFFTPLKSYYISLGFAELTFALICILFPSGKTRTDILG